MFSIFSQAQITAPHKGSGTVSNSNGYEINSLCGVDQFGRTFSPVTGTRSDRYVGMFYFLLLGQHPEIMSGIYDNTAILEADAGKPMLNLFNIKGTAISPVNQFHYWGQPLYQYYNSLDEYVLRRHVEMLTAAGIDFLVFDVTNASTYDSVWIKLFRVLDSYQKQGWNVPKVAFYTNSYSELTMTHLYSVLYSKNLFPNLWFRPDGKRPMIIGKMDAEPSAGMEKILRDFFYFRTSQWPDERAHCGGCADTTVFHPDGIPWIDWQKPQRLYGGGNIMSIMNVAPAQHPQLPFSDSYLIGSLNWGRGFTMSTRLNDSIPSTGNANYRYVSGKNDTSKVDIGANFEQEWKLALKTDPQMIFVTEWNQWGAIKQAYDQGTANERIIFVDVFNKEYSLDLEPMKGGYNDAFYFQLIQNVRKYKNISGTPVQPVRKTIDINGAVNQWDDVTNIYRSIGNENYGRNCISVAASGPQYVQPMPLNNLQEIRVTNDANNLYFYIKAENTLSAHSDGTTNWMNLFIGTNQIKKQGWEGYNFVVNRAPNGSGKTTVEKLDSTAKGTKVADADYLVSNNIMQIKIPKSALSISDTNFQFYFKVADGVQKPTDIMDYYVTGKSLPLGRLSFSYNNNTVTSIMQSGQQSPHCISLSQNYPNPFNPVTEISYTIPNNEVVSLKVFNLLGQEVATLVNKEQPAGEYKVNFDATRMASGVYLYRLQAGNLIQVRKMTVLK